MTQPLGDRVRARREVLRGLANRARDEAQRHADHLRDQLRIYVDDQIKVALTQMKTYVDTRIDDLIAHNDLTP